MRTQQGFSLWRVLRSLLFWLLLGYLAWLIVPVYLQNYQVLQALEEMPRLPASSVATDNVIDQDKVKQLFNKQLLNYGVTNYQLDELSITPKANGGYTIVFKYWVVKPVFKNMNLMFHFEEKQEVAIGTK